MLNNKSDFFLCSRRHCFNLSWICCWCCDGCSGNLIKLPSCCCHCKPSNCSCSTCLPSLINCSLPKWRCCTDRKSSHCCKETCGCSNNCCTLPSCDFRWPFPSCCVCKCSCSCSCPTCPKVRPCCCCTKC